MLALGFAPALSAELSGYASCHTCTQQPFSGLERDSVYSLRAFPLADSSLDLTTHFTD